MKKLLMLSSAVVMLICASCKKHCGYCDYNTNGIKGKTYCESDSKENYASVKRSCDAVSGTTWRITE